ncbi:MAG: nuclear transport factor 2 family protein [Proteobacteria bacterium]|nr:nuclear transport factor 2 family protein [Pseudomonadota bacterium]
MQETISISNGSSVGQRVQYASQVLLKGDDLEAYLHCMSSVFAENIHYIDPVHELRGKSAVVEMLRKYVPRLKNEPFEFSLVHDGNNCVIWRWVLNMKIRYTPFRFTIHGLVHAELEGEKIVRQREYYDPMESIGVIPIIGALYKLALKLG